jgi:hypothetical protein
MPTWIALKDENGARLKLAKLDVSGQPVLHLFVTNLAFTNPRWRECVTKLNFREAPNRKYLVRRVDPDEKLRPSSFKSVFPGAVRAEMPVGDYMLQIGSKNVARRSEEGAASVDLRGVQRLGRNANGQEVYDCLSGRFYLGGRENSERITESADRPVVDFLRLMPPGQPLPQGPALAQALMLVAKGFVRSMDQGEVQRTEDYMAFRSALIPDADRGLLSGQEIDDLLSRAIDGALLRHVRGLHDVASEAYMPMARLYDYLPPHAGRPRGAGVVPQPLNVAIQRLLGDTTDKTVLVPNAFDGASFAYLPEGSRIRAFQGLHGRNEAFDGFAIEHPGALWQGQFTPAAEQGADALLFNADPVRDDRGGRRDFTEALMSLRSLAPGARAVIALAGDGGLPGQVSDESAQFLRALGARCSVENVFETAPILSQKAGGVKGLRVYSLRNVPGDMERIEILIASGVTVLSSWEQVKTHVDETINTLEVREAESDRIDVERVAEQESYQRPYIAFSKVGEARTMVPANLQSTAQAYLTHIEKLYGPVDEFVGKELGMGFATLQANFSPEQVDGVAVMISRLLIGRSSILADDTGIGKGRQLAAMATWANKHGLDVVFVTDRANLFSDLARDLKDIGEWERFRPLVLNTDGEVTYEEYPGAEPTVLAKGTPAPVMADILERGASLQDVQANIAFLTYSQISTVDSPKALWVKNQLGNALVIFDEAHIAAGSDSNVAVQVAEMASLAKHTQFASATWAKSHQNMHIYQRAFPTSVSMATLAETMRKGGESFSEIFSSMVSHDGALIRREHDLSKLDVEMLIDEQRRQRNEAVSDAVADVLGSASYINGDMQQVFMRSNADSVRKLKAARDVRLSQTRKKARLFSSGFGAGSVIYEVMKGVQGSLNAEFVADLAVQSIRDGMKPVIVSDSTGERLLEAIIEIEAQRMKSQRIAGDVTHVQMPTLRDLLRRVVLRHLATIRVAEVDVEDVTDDADLRDLETDELDGGDAQAIGEAAAAAAQAAMDVSGQGGGVAALPVAVNTTWPFAPVIADANLAQDAPAEETGVDVQAAFALGTGDLAAPPASVAGDEGDAEAPMKKAKKKRIIYRDVPIAELNDIPEEARQKYAAGLLELEAKINAVPEIPVLSFDVIAQRLRGEGYSVGEISGRKKQLILDEQSGAWVISSRSTSKKSVKGSIRAFNNGGLQALIINRSASTGVSMHSSPRFLDQARRRLIEHQIPENPVDRIQLLGRVNRFDQMSSPLITTASTGIYGEVRYLMMQNKKLARMSANVRSSRDNAMSLKSIRDLFNVVGKEAVEEFLGDNALVAKRLGLSASEIENAPDVVNKLTMRIPLLSVKQQEMVYNDLYSRMDEILFRAELEGVNPLKPGEMDLRAKTEEERVFFGQEDHDEGLSSAFDAPVMVRKISWSQTRSPLSFPAVRGICDVNVDRLVDEGVLELPSAAAQNAAQANADAQALISRAAMVDAAEDAATAALNAINGSNVPAPGDAPDQMAAAPENATAPAEAEPGEGQFVSDIGPRLSPALSAQVLEGFHGLTRLSHMSSEIDQFDEAVKNHVQTRRAYVKWQWLKKNLPFLAPGVRLMDNRPIDERNVGALDLFGHMRGAVIVDVRPPIPAHLLDLGKWQISVISPGDERPKTFSLRTIVSKVEGIITTGGVTGDLQCSFMGHYITPGLYSPRMRSGVERSFDWLSRGKRTQDALVLTGNVYLAAEWAAATGIGRSIIYTDDAGQRHRAIGLPKDVSNLDPEQLPVRIADPQALRHFMLPMMMQLTAEEAPDFGPEHIYRASNAVEPDYRGVYVLDTTFKSAMALASNSGVRNALLVVDPRRMIAITCASDDVRRVRAGLSAGQNAIRKATFGRIVKAAEDPGSVSLSVMKTVAERVALPPAVRLAVSRVFGLGGSADWLNVGGRAVRGESKTAVICLRFSTPEQSERAIAMLTSHFGLELYASEGAMRESARAAMRKAAWDLREQMRQRQEAVSGERAILRESSSAQESATTRAQVLNSNGSMEAENLAQNESIDSRSQHENTPAIS